MRWQDDLRVRVLFTLSATFAMIAVIVVVFVCVRRWDRMITLARSLRASNWDQFPDTAAGAECDADAVERCGGDKKFCVVRNDGTPGCRCNVGDPPVDVPSASNRDAHPPCARPPKNWSPWREYLASGGSDLDDSDDVARFVRWDARAPGRTVFLGSEHADKWTPESDPLPVFNSAFGVRAKACVDLSGEQFHWCPSSSSSSPSSHHRHAAHRCVNGHCVEVNYFGVENRRRVVHVVFGVVCVISVVSFVFGCGFAIVHGSESHSDTGITRVQQEKT